MADIGAGFPKQRAAFKTNNHKHQGVQRRKTKTSVVSSFLCLFGVLCGCVGYGEEEEKFFPEKANCAKNESRLRVELNTDRYGFETSWTLTNTSTRQKVAFGPPENRKYGSSRTYIGAYCLPSGSYRFVIKDLFKDGICCGHGRGSYDLKLDGVSLLEGDAGGQFGAREVTGFVVSNGPGQSDDDVSQTGGAISDVLTPFDANLSDLIGPNSWQSQYGKTPEIIVASDGVTLDVLAQDYDSSTPQKAVLFRVEHDGNQYVATQILTDLPMLDRVMGLDRDAEGHRYYATGVDERDRVDSSYPRPKPNRTNIVRVVKIDARGRLLFNIDVDRARHAFDRNARSLINPMVASTARLAVGDTEIGLVHGINTEPDWDIEGKRHQMLASTRFDIDTGDVTQESSVWCSHDFDHRLFFDGSEIVELHLGDAHPRHIVLAKDNEGYPLFYIKGKTGVNNTFTRLGNIASIDNDRFYDYLLLFATESTADIRSGTLVSGPRNLALVRVNGSDGTVDGNLPDRLRVTSGGRSQTNKLLWLTNYSRSSKLHAERPKLVGIGGNRYVVLWEEWQIQDTKPRNDTWNGVYGMVIDASGDIVQEKELITDAHHLHRGDDAFLLNGNAGWMTGDSTTGEIQLHLVDRSLNYQLVTIM
jgi:hypothetical protein